MGASEAGRPGHGLSGGGGEWRAPVAAGGVVTARLPPPSDARGGGAVPGGAGSAAAAWPNKGRRAARGAPGLAGERPRRRPTPPRGADAEGEALS